MSEAIESKVTIFVAGNVLRSKTSPCCIVMVNVTPKEWQENGVNASAPGVLGFGEMCFGEDPTNHRSFARIHEPTWEDGWDLLGTIQDFTLERLKELVR